jgi:hypothetical protein
MMAEVYTWVGVGVARMCGDSPAMDEVAGQLMAAVLRRAADHRLTGNYIDHLKVKNVPGKKGVRDRIVEATDKAAYSIEWGHYTQSGTWVPGQHILGGAINDIL